MTLDSGHETSLPFPSLALCPGYRPSMPPPPSGRLEDTGGTLVAAIDAYFRSDEAAANYTFDEWQERGCFYILFLFFTCFYIVRWVRRATYNLRDYLYKATVKTVVSGGGNSFVWRQLKAGQLLRGKETMRAK